MKWGWLKTIAKTIATAASLGLIGRGRKTQKAGELAGELIDSLESKESKDGPQ